jgi:hypothetical protein
MYISIDDKEVHHQRESYFCFIEILLNIHLYIVVYILEPGKNPESYGYS